MNELTENEFIKAVQGEFKIEPWQVELLENIQLMSRLRQGYYVGARRSGKWFRTLRFLEACWKMEIPTCLVTPDYEVRQKIEIIYDDLVDVLRYTP